MEFPEANQDFRALLRREFASRKRRNPAFSQRAFARFLGVSKTSLADVFADKRGFSPKNALRIAEKLCLSPSETEAFVSSLAPRRAPSSQKLLLEDDQYSLISDWEHYAILNLARLQEHQASPRWLAKRLGLPVGQVRGALERLERLKLVRIKAGKLVRTEANLTTRSDIPSSALRKFQKQNLQLAELSLENDSLQSRDMTSITMAIDPKKLPIAKKLCQQFRRRMGKAMDGGTPSEVYTFALQLFPITRGEKGL